MINNRRLILGLALLAVRVMAGDLNILAVGPFGQPLQGCRVESFRTHTKEPEKWTQYGNHFHGLAGKRIPLGEYQLRINCGGAEISKDFTVMQATQFEVVALRGRQFISDHVKPKLPIHLDMPAPADETWWIRLVGVYNGKDYMDRFAQGTNEAAITEPDPGSYLVTVASTTGYVCVREVDFVEFTKAWTFHPASCSFDFDQFAHLVQEEDKRNKKRGGWYEEMRVFRDTLRRETEEDIRKSAEAIRKK